MTNLIPTEATTEESCAQAVALEIIEHAERATPYCDWCSLPTIPVARGEEIWLECQRLSVEKSLARRLLTLDFAFGHTTRMILDSAA